MNSMRIGSLFSGGGGLDMAVEAVFGGEMVWHCEVDDAASKVLAAHWLGVRNLGDVVGVDWATVEPVDIMCGGFPCQDVSTAGRRAGIKDGTRSGLWAQFARAIAILRPPIVVIENVRGLLSAEAHRAVESADTTMGDGPGRPVLRAAGAVLGDLADLGYDAQWTTVAAADVGAPHRRERVFIVATDSECPTGGASASIWARPGEAPRGGPCGVTGRRGVLPTNPARDGWNEGRPEPARLIGGPNAAVGSGGPVELLPTPAVNDMGDDKTLEWWDEFIARSKAKGYNGNGHGKSLSIEVRRELLPTPTTRDGKGANQRGDETCLTGALLPTPRKSDGDGGANPLSRAERMDDIETRIIRIGPDWGKYEPAIRRWESLTRPAPSPTEPNTKGNPRLSAAFSEWLMGWPAGWVTDVPGISRNDALRIIGNGVVPQQATAALQWLLSVGERAA